MPQVPPVDKSRDPQSKGMEQGQHGILENNLDVRDRHAGTDGTVSTYVGRTDGTILCTPVSTL